MNKNFPKPIKNRLIIGLLLILIAVVLGILLDGKFTGPGSLMMHRMIYIVCVIGLGLGGLAFIFLSWMGLFLGIGFVLIIALPQCLPDPWNRYFSFLYLACLCGLPPLLDRLKKRKTGASRKSTTSQGNSRRTRLRQFRTGLMIATGAIGLPWLFLDVPYNLFSALSLLPFPITLGIICLFPEDISLDDSKHKQSHGRVEFVMPLVFSGFAPAMRTLLDFNYLTWKPLLIQSGILLVLIGVLLFVFCKELRQRFWYFFGILFLCTMFCFGTIGQLNYLLDTSVPKRQSATITDMHISTGSKSPDQYILTLITLSGMEMELKTGKEHYDTLSVGESVTVYIKDGGLGIPYAIAN